MTCLSRPSHGPESPPTCTHSIFPAFKITTWNVNGLHIKNPYDTSKRVKILISNIVILLPNYEIFFSGLTTSKAGVITIASRHISGRFQHNSCPSNDRSGFPHKSLAGYALPVYVTPKPDTTNLTSAHHYKSLILNCYLDDKNQQAQVAQLEHLCSIPTADFNFAAGDWNFINSPTDALPYNHATRKLSEDFSETWTKFVTRFKLTEFHQPAHTRFSVNGSSSSRIDRIYGSFSDAERTAYTPLCFTPTIPHSILDAILDRENTTNPTDHLPVTVHFQANDTKVNSANSTYPPDLIYSPTFRTAFFHLICTYENSVKFRNSVSHRNAVFKLATHRAMSATKKHWNKDNQTALVLATRALRAIDNNKQALAATLVSKDPALTHTLASDTQVDLEKLKDFLNNHQDSYGSAPAPSPTTSHHNDTLQKHLDDKKLKHNYLRQLSNSLPNNKLRFHTLRKNDRSPPTNDPTEMSNIASEFWAPHWSWEKFDRHSSLQLLQGFDRKLTQEILTVDEELCKEVILQAGDTACGPDLIPFSVYKSLIDFTAPLLNDTYHAAASGAPPPNGANHSNLHLIPKCDSDNICHSRPINVGNTDVRLLGAIVHKSIYDAVEKLISKRQKGFMKTRNILDNIKLITEKIHQATTNKKDYDVLFIDFKKDFDSLNPNFLFSLLEHIDMPTIPPSM